jgi:hypothetical protein
MTPFSEPVYQTERRILDTKKDLEGTRQVVWKKVPSGVNPPEHHYHCHRLRPKARAELKAGCGPGRASGCPTTLFLYPVMICSKLCNIFSSEMLCHSEPGDKLLAIGRKPQLET